MAGGGVVADTCLAFNRKCWSFDMDDRPDRRPEIEPYFWDITHLKWPIKGKTKPDLIIFDPPYFKKQSNHYDPDGISGLSKEKYLEFLESFFALAHRKNNRVTHRFLRKSGRFQVINSLFAFFHSERYILVLKFFINLSGKQKTFKLSCRKGASLFRSTSMT